MYGATSEKAQWLRFHTQTAGVSLTAQQPDNNVVRTALEALAAVLGGTNSLHTNALDEVLALPSAKAAEIALRTQQVILEETGVANVADPLGGSWYVEALTDALETEAEAIFARIRAMGESTDPSAQPHPVGPMTAGILRGIETGWFNAEIAESAFVYQRAVEKGEKKQVGVNVHLESIETPLEIMRVSHEVERDQVALLAAAQVGSRRGARGGAARRPRPCRGDGVRGAQPRAADAGRRPRRGDARRDLRRAAQHLGRLPRGRVRLTLCDGPPRSGRLGA